MCPLVSIILPVYNGENYINDCINSIIKQTYQNWELVIVNDGSVDSTQEICAQFVKHESRIKLIKIDNSGVSTARNTGIEAAQGEYIVFCDSDDYYEKEYLEFLIKTAYDYPTYDHIWCCFQTVSGSDHENAKVNHLFEEPVVFFSSKDIMTLHEMWLDSSPCNKLYRMDIIKSKRVRFQEGLSLGEDYLFNLSYLDCFDDGKIAVIARPLYNYRRNREDSLDTKYRDNLLNIFKHLNQECFNYLKKRNVSMAQWKMFHNNVFYMYERVLRNNMRAPNQTQDEKVKTNNGIIRGNEFRNALNQRTCFIHPLYILAYHTGNYRYVLAVDQIVKIKNKIMKR